MQEPTNAQLMSMLATIAGGQLADRHAIAVLIGDHRTPDSLLELWQQSKPEWIDDAAENPLFRGIPEYQQGYLQRMAVLTEFLEENERISRPE